MKVTQSMFVPTRDNVVVLVPVLEKKTEAGIHLPEAVLEKRAKELGLNNFLEVIAVGPEVEGITVGSRVLCSRITELPVEADEEGFKVAIMRAYDIAGFYL